MFKNRRIAGIAVSDCKDVVTRLCCVALWLFNSWNSQCNTYLCPIVFILNMPITTITCHRNYHFRFAGIWVQRLKSGQSYLSISCLVCRNWHEGFTRTRGLDGICVGQTCHIVLGFYPLLYLFYSCLFFKASELCNVCLFVCKSSSFNPTITFGKHILY